MAPWFISYATSPSLLLSMTYQFQSHSGKNSLHGAMGNKTHKPSIAIYRISGPPFRHLLLVCNVAIRPQMLKVSKPKQTKKQTTHSTKGYLVILDVGLYSSLSHIVCEKNFFAMIKIIFYP